VADREFDPKIFLRRRCPSSLRPSLSRLDVDPVVHGTLGAGSCEEFLYLIKQDPDVVDGQFAPSTNSHGRGRPGRRPPCRL
jgi:hypothetical protein